MSIGGDKRRGHSLIELMVASALLMLLMGLIYDMFVAGKRYQDNCQAKIELQNNVFKSMSTIAKDLVEGDKDAINPQSVTNSIVFASPRSYFTGLVSFDGDGRLRWQKKICYFLKPQSGSQAAGLYRKAVDLPSDPATGEPYVQIPPVGIPDDVINNTTIVARFIAPNIVGLNTSLPGGGVVEMIVEAKLTLLIHQYGVQVKTAVLPQN